MTQEGFKRKLTAILCADVKGYSRLMGENEESTVRTLTAYREVISTLIKDHKGRVVDSPGDNILAEFVSIVDALRCAWDIQQEIKSRNADLPENRRMNFRIGVNLGDVIEERDRIYGDGVNIVARIEALAEEGGICISGTAYDQVKNKLPFRYEYDGEQTVKNIKEPVRVYSILMKPETARKVMADNKVRRKTWRKVVLSAVIVLVVVAGGFIGWYLYHRQAAQIEPASSDKMAFPLPDKPSIDLDPEFAAAYVALGFTHFHEWSFGWSQDPQSLERALELAQKTLDLDDSLPLGHRLLGKVYSRKKQHEKAIAELKKAIALSPNSADGLVGLGYILNFAGRPKEAIGLVKKAMRLNPMYPAYYLWELGHGYFITGRYEEAIETLKRVLDRNSDFMPAHLFLAASYSEIGREEEARAEVAEIERLNPQASLEALRPRLSYKDQAVIERLIDSLRKAGLK